MNKNFRTVSLFFANALALRAELPVLLLHPDLHRRIPPGQYRRDSAFDRALRLDIRAGILGNIRRQSKIKESRPRNINHRLRRILLSSRRRSLLLVSRGDAGFSDALHVPVRRTHRHHHPRIHSGKQCLLRTHPHLRHHRFRRASDAPQRLYGRQHLRDDSTPTPSAPSPQPSS